MPDGAQKYGFEEQLSKGRIGEKSLEIFCKKHDRPWRTNHYGDVDAEVGVKSEPVSVKTDWAAAETGNVFIEYDWAVWYRKDDARNKRGWAHISSAKWLWIYIPGKDYAYLVPMQEIKEKEKDWRERYPKKRILQKGKNYVTWGRAIPLSTLLNETSCRKYTAVMVFKDSPHS